MIYLDCGCSITESGERCWCPTCTSTGNTAPSDQALYAEIDRLRNVCIKCRDKQAVMDSEARGLQVCHESLQKAVEELEAFIEKTDDQQILYPGLIGTCKLAQDVIYDLRANQLYTDRIANYEKHMTRLHEDNVKLRKRVDELENRRMVWLAGKLEELPVSSCKGNDPTCPCQDGDPCNYEGDDPLLTADEILQKYERRIETLLTQRTAALAVVRTIEQTIDSEGLPAWRLRELHDALAGEDAQC